MQLGPRRIKLLFLSAATVATAGAGLILASTPADAQSPTLIAYGGPQEVYVSGTGYAAYGPNDSVRVTVLTGDGRIDLGQEGNYGSFTGVNVNNGDLTADFNNLGYSGGPVQVWVDDLTTDSTQYTQATTTPELQFTNVYQKGCEPQGSYGNYVVATARNFLADYSARFELLTNNLSVLSTYSTNVDTNEYATAGPQQLWTYDYQGWAWVVVDETGYGTSAGLPAPYGNIPAPATAWYRIDLC